MIVGLAFTTIENSCVDREPAGSLATITTAASPVVPSGGIPLKVAWPFATCVMINHDGRVGAVIVMRYKAPEIQRPYRTIGYPIVPLVYITIAVLIVLDLAWLAPWTSGIGYLLVLTGIPVYFVWRKKQG